jgi:hypothetical protein
MADKPITPAEDAVYLAIINRTQEPDPTSYQAGWNAHARGEPFGRPGVNHHTVAALSWRIGWNDRALRDG